jgi:hypothetical protein
MTADLPDSCRRACHDPSVTARVGPIDRKVVELAKRIGKPAALVAVVVDDEERAGALYGPRTGRWRSTRPDVARAGPRRYSGRFCGARIDLAINACCAPGGISDRGRSRGGEWFR